MSDMQLLWRGIVVNDYKDIYQIMLTLTTLEEIAEFKSVLSKQTAYPDALWFKGALAGNDIETAKELLTRFSGRDCKEAFFVVSAPRNEEDEEGDPQAILKVKLMATSFRLILLEVLAPRSIAQQWDGYNPACYEFMVTDGPARKLSLNKWRALVGYKSSEEAQSLYGMASGVGVAVRLVTGQLRNDELAALAMWEVLGKNPKEFLHWEKVKPLFTSADSDKPQMHDAVWEALSDIVNERIYGNTAPQSGKKA